MRVGVLGSGFQVWGLGLGFRVQDLGSRVSSFELRVQGSGYGYKV